jgi:hypothetical protein
VLRLGATCSRQFGFKLGNHKLRSNTSPCSFCFLDGSDAPTQEFSLMLAFQNCLTYGIFDEFRKRFAWLKDTLNFDPELRRDANGGGWLQFSSLHCIAIAIQIKNSRFPLPLQTYPPQASRLASFTAEVARTDWGRGPRRFLGV